MNIASLNTSNLVKHLKMHHTTYTQYRHQFLQANAIHYWNNLFLGLFESLLHYSFENPVLQMKDTHTKHKVQVGKGTISIFSQLVCLKV